MLHSALNLVLRILKPGGTFVAKIFRGKDVDLIYAQLRCFFADVSVAKPRSSRASSLEAFVVCRGFQGGSEKRETAANSESVNRTKGKGSEKEEEEEEEWIDGQKRTERDDGITVLEYQDDESDDDASKRWIAPFVACGDLSAWDSDATYHLPKDRVSLDPVQPPTAPPYKRALDIRRRQGGAYGKTGKGGGVG
ncbi:MAG: hypothetical protein L6R35_007591 [Caloplaca aegaea]|nr:MAG: hypothetical protein L6R35_007591 [Caloplaca aegaea]